MKIKYQEPQRSHKFIHSAQIDVIKSLLHKLRIRNWQTEKSCCKVQTNNKK